MERLGKILVGLFVALLIFIYAYTMYVVKTARTENVITSHSDTLYIADTTKHTSATNHFHIQNVYGAKPAKSIDTAEIIENYFTKRFVSDTLTDSLVSIIIQDTLFNNQIQYRKRQYQLLKPYQKIITNTITVNKQHTGIYTGCFFGINKGFTSYGVQANYVTGKNIFGLGYDLRNNAVTANVSFKIGKK